MENNNIYNLAAHKETHRKTYKTTHWFSITIVLIYRHPTD